jgi:signal transduction histidine kinase
MIDLSDRVAQIAQGLLSYCRPSGAARASLDIRVPIGKALAMVETRAVNMGIQVEQDLAPDLPPVCANGQEMEQVALNLLLNALDAMPAGGRMNISARTERTLPEDREMVVVSVADTGSGIPPDIRDRIFEPFFTTKQSGRGTGLGLSICEGLIRSHGGRIDIASSPGKGSRFDVTLPTDDESPEAEVHHGEDTNTRR